VSDSGCRIGSFLSHTLKLRITVQMVHFLLKHLLKQRTEVAGVTFSDSDSAPVPNFFNPGPSILQIWESDSCSHSGYNHPSNRNFPMFLPKKWPHRLLLLPKWKSDSGTGSVFSQTFDSGSSSDRKTQNPAGVETGNPVLVPPLREISCCAPRFPLISTARFHPLILRSRSWKFWKGRSRKFYHRLRNPDCDLPNCCDTFGL